MTIFYAIITALTSLMAGKSSDKINDTAEKIYQGGDYSTTSEGIIVIDTNDLS